MKGNKRVLTILNSLLADELTAINQYMIQAEMYNHLGYLKLNMETRKQTMAEMQQAEWLIERIIFFDVSPTISNLNPPVIGTNVEEMINSDYGGKLNAIRNYIVAIKLATEVGDQETVELLTMILKMEEDHVDWVNAQRAQIQQMGLENYLQDQTMIQESDPPKEKREMRKERLVHAG